MIVVPAADPGGNPFRGELMPETGFLVVARYVDGRMVRGMTNDFRPGRTFFHVLAEDARTPVRVTVDELKAIFYVKTLFGDHTHVGTNTFRHRQGYGRKVWVRFKDGERLAGWATSYTPEKGGFFLFPTDASSNAERAFIVNHAVAEVRLDEDAQVAASEYEEVGGKPEGARASVRQLSSDEWNHMLGIDSPSTPGSPQKPDPPPTKQGNSGAFLGDW